MAFLKKSKSTLGGQSSSETADSLFEARKMYLDRQKYEEEKEIFYRMKSEKDYALPEDKDLTEEQKAELDRFWKKYEFIGKIDYEPFKTYYNRSGIADPRYLPQYIYSYFLRPNTVPKSYLVPFQNKAYLPCFLPAAKQPEMIVRKVEGNYYNSSFEHITREEAVRLSLAALEQGNEIVVKPSGKAGGKGVEFFAEATAAQLHELFRKKGKLFVVQKAIRQHPEMKKLNPSTVNTVRLTTVLHNGKFTPAAALIKVGSPNVRVDNYKHGGLLLGVNMDGTVLPWALNIDRQRVTELPSGVKLGEGGFTKVPCFDSVLATAEKAHFCIPKIKVVSWDIAIDEENEAEIIEANFAGDLRMHQVLTGPVFGDLTEELLDSYVLSKYGKPGITEDFDYTEFADHIVIDRYMGSDKIVTVPDTITGKPVTAVGKYAFAYNRSIKELTLPDSVSRIGSAAFIGCVHLTKLNLNLDSLKNVGRKAVNFCGRLDVELKKAIRAKG